MFVLVESLQDHASRTIADALRGLVAGRAAGRFQGNPVITWDDAALVTIEGLHIHAEALDEELAAHGLEADAILFLSRHASRSGHPTLTVHPLGNFADAALGGQPRRFTPVPAALMTQTLRNLARVRTDAGYEAEVAFEVTHHGPLLSTPAFFVELGSDETAWRDPRGGRVVAEAVLATLAKPAAPGQIAIGLGGGHYAPRFTEAALRHPVHYGHLWPRHHMVDPAGVPETLAALAQATPGVDGVHTHQVPPPMRAALADAAARLELKTVEPGSEADPESPALRRGHQ